jgi:hypothetical protein
MPTRTSIRLSLALALTLTAGAASVPTIIAAQPAKPAPAACFWARNIDNFNAPDDRTVNLRVGVHDVYQLKLFSSCIDVDWDQRIALRAHGSDWICEGDNVDDEIDAHSAMGPQRCPVTSVRKLTPEQVAALPKRDRP